MKFKEDINWFIINILGHTEINFKNLNLLERYFLKRITKKISKIKTKKNEYMKLKGRKIDLVLMDEADYVDYNSIKNIKPKGL